MFKERRRPYKILFVIVDFLMIMFSWYVAYILRREINWPTEFLITDEKNRWYFYSAVFGSFTHIIIFLGSNLYNSKREQNFAVELKSLVAGSVINLVVMIAVIFFFRPISYSRGFFIYQSLVVIVLVSIGHYTIRRVLRYLSSRGFNARYVMIVGSGEASARFYRHLAAHVEFGYNVVSIIGSKTEVKKNFKDEHKAEALELVNGNFKNFKKVAHELNEEGKLDLIIAALPPGDHEQLTDIYRFCEFESVDMKIIPDYLSVLAITGRVEEIEGLPVLSINTVPLLRGYNWLSKRIFDIIFSFFAVLLSLPFQIAIAIAIKLDSPGPVFIRQERMGLDRKPFYMLKFRTMRVQNNTESDTVWTVKDDPRRTLTGKLLRRFSIDEIPQFWNVLVGHMSVVGPRPERPHFVEQFKHEITGYMLRHRMKAGVTGWAQVNGLRGDTSITERVKHDIYYIENWSIWFDIRICIRTLRALFSDDGAY